MSIEETLQNLQVMYKKLEGETFQGTYLGEYQMPQTGNERYIIKGDNLSGTLTSISSSVINTYGTRVWKGITGPEDSRMYTNYLLWVEPDVGEMPLEGRSYYFKIERCTPFPCEVGSFSCGVSIKAIIIQAVPSLA